MQAGKHRQRHEGSDGQHIAVRELDDIKDAEEQGEADGNKRVHHAEHQPVHDVLSKQPHIHDVDLTVRARTIARRGSREPRLNSNCYFCPGSLRLPLAYSLSSHSTNLPSWITYFVITATVF